MPNLDAEGFIWLALVLGPVLVGAVAVLLSLPDVGLRPGARLAWAIGAVVMGLAAISLFWMRAARFGCFGAMGASVALVGARNLFNAYGALLRGERSLTLSERHVRAVARKVYDPWIQESRLTFEQGVAYLELFLSDDAPLRNVRLNLTSLAEKSQSGLSDPALERAIDVRPAIPLSEHREAEPGNGDRIS